MRVRPNLVIARVGDTSLHPNWLNSPGEERSWDLILSCFGDHPEKYRGDDWLLVESKGPKFRPLYDLIQSHWPLIEEYDYIWLLEDDLDCKCRDINRLFEVCRRERLDVAQPALTHDSYFSHPITLYSPFFRLRYTSFVEIMAPCFSRRALSKLLPTFRETVSGWGLDDVWPTLLGDDASAIAIVDDVRIRHTRPVGGGTLYKVVKGAAQGAWDEREELLRKYGVARRRYWIREAIRTSGRRVPDGFWFLWLYGLGLLTAIPRLRKRWREIPRVWLSAMHQQIKGRRKALPPAGFASAQGR
jgi:hypothetical protein